MPRTTRALDREWQDDYAHSTEGIMALRRWEVTEPALRGPDDLDHLLKARTDPQRAQGILGALARYAPCDPVAARTFLQASLPGLVVLARRTLRRDPSRLRGRRRPRLAPDLQLSANHRTILFGGPIG